MNSGLKDVIKVYFDKRKREKWSTRQWRARAWALLIEAVGNISIDEFSYQDIEDYEAYLFSQGQVQNGVRSYLKAVSGVIVWAEHRGYRIGNPFDSYRYPRQIENEIRTYNQAEMCDLRASASTIRWRALIETAYSAGLRRSEALNLRIEDVDFERNVIRVQPHKGSNDTWPWRPKNDKGRRLPLTQQTSQLYCEMLSELPAGQPYLLLTEKQYWKKRNLYRAGKLAERDMLTPDSGFDSAFRRIRKRAGLETGTYHDIRRTCLTLWSQKVAPQDLHKLAGHANIETTMRYYLAVRADVLDLLRKHNIGATGLEPATS